MGHPLVDRIAVSKALTSVNPDHPELLAAHAAGIPATSCQQLIADAAATFGGTLLAVAGTHGKSTTTGWLVHLLSGGGRGPLGLRRRAAAGRPGRRRRTGRRPDRPRRVERTPFVVEADEYAGNFDPYRPTIGVLAQRRLGSSRRVPGPGRRDRRVRGLDPALSSRLDARRQCRRSGCCRLAAEAGRLARPNPRDRRRPAGRRCPDPGRRAAPDDPFRRRRGDGVDGRLRGPRPRPTAGSRGSSCTACPAITDGAPGRPAAWSAGTTLTTRWVPPGRRWPTAWSPAAIAGRARLVPGRRPALRAEGRRGWGRRDRRLRPPPDGDRGDARGRQPALPGPAALGRLRAAHLPPDGRPARAVRRRSWPRPTGWRSPTSSRCAIRTRRSCRPRTWPGPSNGAGRRRSRPARWRRPRTRSCRWSSPATSCW